MSEYVSPSSLTKFAVQTDLSEIALIDAAEEMGVHPSQLIVFINRSFAPYAKEIANKHGCTIILVPEEILKRDHWAVHHKDRHEFGMWSEGA